jgi:uncharacterized protein (DUF1800 family)
LRGCLLTAQDPDRLQPKVKAMNAIRPRVFDSRRQFLLALAAVCGPGVAGLSGCAAPPQTQAAGSGGVGAAAAPAGATVTTRADVYRCVNRLGWGATAKMVDHAMRTGYERFVDEQLKAHASGGMPTEVQAQIDALTIQKTPMHSLLQQVEALRKKGETLPTEDERKAAQKAYQQELSRLAREAATRHLLRAVYSEDQLFEHMTWFWFNHFNVHQYKGHIRAMLGDYEERAIRPHALGRFRDLLGAVTRHPAMLRYLDNEQNAANRINENHARELLELHTLGVDGGYQQRDVQELARVLTGFGSNVGGQKPNLRREWAGLYQQDGAFEFNPNRHDFGDKTVLGQTVRGRGAAELDEVLDWVAAHPSTARFVSRKMAQFFLSDDPPAVLVERMARRFQDSGGQVAATLRVLLLSPEFTATRATSAQKFKDPVHFVVSAVRASYEDKVILNTTPMQNWLNRMGEGLYNHQTPDGYPLSTASWASSGQLVTRFEIAKALGSGNAGLFKTDGPRPREQPGFPQLANALYYDTLRTVLGADTRGALDQAGSAQEWNALFLSSPEFMYR